MTEIPVTAQAIKQFTLKNQKGTIINILNLGASIFNLWLKDKSRNDVNVVVGPKHPDDFLSEDYLKEGKCFGASVGRYAGRISGGEFELNDEIYTLYQDNGVHLHGGFRGLQYKIWDMDSQNFGINPSIIFSCFSKDMEEGYPGNLKVKVKYTLTEEDELQIEYSATTDKSTPVNLTNHTYFNLDGKGNVSDHELYVNSNKILEVDKSLMPTGGFVNLNGNIKNFSEAKKIQQNEVDDTFVLNSGEGTAAILFSPHTGIELEVKTDQSAIVVYIPGKLPEKWEYQTNMENHFPSVCMETENFSDAPNHENFPSSILHPGKVYRNTSIYKFSIKED